MTVEYPFTTYEEFTEYLDLIDPLDKYNFHKPPLYWKESVAAEIERLELNLSYYREYMKNQSRFPQWVHDKRKEEFERLRQIRGVR